MNGPAYRIAKEGGLGKKYVGCGTVRQQELRDTATEGQKLSAPIMHILWSARYPSTAHAPSNNNATFDRHVRPFPETYACAA